MASRWPWFSRRREVEKLHGKYRSVTLVSVKIVVGSVVYGIVMGAMAIGMVGMGILRKKGGRSDGGG